MPWHVYCLNYISKRLETYLSVKNIVFKYQRFVSAFCQPDSKRMRYKDVAETKIGPIAKICYTGIELFFFLNRADFNPFMSIIGPSRYDEVLTFEKRTLIMTAVCAIFC